VPMSANGTSFRTILNGVRLILETVAIVKSTNKYKHFLDVNSHCA
jgi:hypothetical protein